MVIGNTARRALWLYIAHREKEFPTHLTDRLFPMTKMAVRFMLNHLAKRAGVTDVHPHRFRHSFAIWYLRGGGDIFTLQRILGHSSLDMVSYYLEYAQTDVASAHRRASPLDRWNSNGAL